MTAAMTVADSLWMVMPDIEPWLKSIFPAMPYDFPYSIFWWQSIIDILFSALCIHTLILCYLTHKIDDSNRGNGDGYIWAFVGNLLARVKGH